MEIVDCESVRIHTFRKVNREPYPSQQFVRLFAERFLLVGCLHLSMNQFLVLGCDGPHVVGWFVVVHRQINVLLGFW